MNTYRQALDALRFTPEQKAAIAETLLSAAQAGQSRTPRRKWGRVIAAAAVAAALCAACASGALQEALSVLASQFGSDPKQQEVIGDLTRPSAASATDNGVTISVDAVMGDGNSLVVLYRMERADGQPVLPQTEETKNVSDGNNTLGFEEDGFTQYFAREDVEIPYGFTMMGDLTFLDFEVTDSTLYFYQRFTLSHAWDLTQPVEITLKNLYSHEHYSAPVTAIGLDREIIDRDIPLIHGSWTLSIRLDGDAPSLSLADGQTFHGDLWPGASFTGTLRELTLSPLAFSVVYDYTVPPSVEEALTREYYQDPELAENLPLDAWIRSALSDYLTLQLPCLTLTDGTQVPLDFSGIGDASQDFTFRFTFAFDEILPLDTVESITIGDLTIPVPRD